MFKVEAYSESLKGGVLIGVASWILLAGVGRISGISSITSGVLTSQRQTSFWRWAFLLGLVGGGALFTWMLGVPHVETRSSLMLVPAGFLVGFGTVLGSGCTSGHGVCGISRLAPRSIVATLTFMASGFLTVYLTRHVFA